MASLHLDARMSATRPSARAIFPAVGPSVGGTPGVPRQTVVGSPTRSPRWILFRQSCTAFIFDRT